MFCRFIFVLLAFIHSVSYASGHGMLLEPVSRASRWRFNKSAPINYDDNGVFCGGFSVQFGINKGKCGVCGDDYRKTIPRPNELGGRFGEGVIIKSYNQADLINAHVKITANHRGHFYFELCNFSEQSKTGRFFEVDDCFEKLSLTDGTDRWYLPTTQSDDYFIPIKLPEGTFCKHCVFRWTYVAGNNYGICENGTGKLGCGNQEHFRACSDITILPKY